MSKPCALITGASYGIGKELASIMAENNHDLILTARSEEVLYGFATELKQKHDIAIHVISCDLADPKGAEYLSRKVEDLGLEINCLINNAGFGLWGDFTDQDLEQKQKMIQLNCTSLMSLCHVFAKDIIKHKGRILNIASVAAFYSGPLMAVYYATKAFVLSFSEALNFELQKHGVSVTAHCPGPTKSHFQENAGMHNSKLFSILPVPDSAPVALDAYKAMMNRETVVVHGFMNRLMISLGKFAPRSMKTAMVHEFQRSKSR